MPRSLLSNEELRSLVMSVLKPGQANYAITLHESSHDGFKTMGALMPYERFFTKALGYRDFEVFVPYFEAAIDTVQTASIQFERKSRFPAPFINRNRTLVREIKALLDSHYYGSAADHVKDSQGGQFHYRATAKRLASDSWDDWGSECALYDEPYSSGQTPSDETSIRNDFVIVRFRRREHRIRQ
jgi:hypothetical protein